MSGLYDVFATTAKHNVMKNTWGHLYPEPGSKHKGAIYISTGYSNCSVIEDDFPTLSCSPQRAELVATAMDLFDLDWDEPAVYRIDCELWFYKSSDDMFMAEKIGRIIKPKIHLEWKLKGR